MAGSSAACSETRSSPSRCSGASSARSDCSTCTRPRYNREVPERTRQKTRGALLQRWSKAAPEERVELLVTTKGRCLILLVGGTIDARSVQILCGRSSFTTMFVTSVVRFSAAPPRAARALREAAGLVRRNPALRKLLLTHNLPGDAKRALQGL